MADIPWRKDGRIVVDAVSTDGRQRHSILTAKDKVVVVKDTEQEDWSALDRVTDIKTGNYTTIIWRQENTTQLTIVAADGTRRWDFSLGELGIEQLRWASIGRQLFYVGMATDGSATTGLIEMPTGIHSILYKDQRKALLGGLDAWRVGANMQEYTLDAAQYRTDVWTIDSTGTVSLLVIRSDGERQGDFTFQGQFADFWTEVRPSPDGKALLVALREEKWVSLQLVTEQTTHVLLDRTDGVDDIGLSAPWSPDSRWFVYAYHKGNDWIATLASRDGQVLWQNLDYVWQGLGIRWVVCDLF